MLKIFIVAVCCAALGAMPMAAGDPDVLTFGVVDSLLEDITKDKRDFLVSEFNTLVKDFTLLNSATSPGGRFAACGPAARSGQMALGIFQGVEFARAQAKYPKLKPLMVATYKRPEIFALLVAKKDGTVTGFADLKGKTVDHAPRP